MVNVVLPPACAPAFFTIHPYRSKRAYSFEPQEITFAFFLLGHGKCSAIPGITMAVAMREQPAVAFIRRPSCGVRSPLASLP